MINVKPKYLIGEKVEIVNYGSICKIMGEFKDISPELIGKKGIITEVHITQNIPMYAIAGIKKYAWYYEDQIKILTDIANS